MTENSTPPPAGALPVGLADTITAFTAGCASRHKRVATEVAAQIEERFRSSFERAETDWPRVSRQVLTVAGLSGRLAALYADLDHSDEIRWIHARFGLRDGQEECQLMFNTRLDGRHCQTVNLTTP